MSNEPVKSGPKIRALHFPPDLNPASTDSDLIRMAQHFKSLTAMQRSIFVAGGACFGYVLTTFATSASQDAIKSATVSGKNFFFQYWNQQKLKNDLVIRDLPPHLHDLSCPLRSLLQKWATGVFPSVDVIYAPSSRGKTSASLLLRAKDLKEGQLCLYVHGHTHQTLSGLMTSNYGDGWFNNLVEHARDSKKLVLVIIDGFNSPNDDDVAIIRYMMQEIGESLLPLRVAMLCQDPMVAQRLSRMNGFEKIRPFEPATQWSVWGPWSSLQPWRTWRSVDWSRRELKALLLAKGIREDQLNLSGLTNPRAALERHGVSIYTPC